MSYIDWNVSKIIESTDVRLPKDYFVKLNRAEVFELKKMMRPRKIIYIWIEDEDKEYLMPRKVSRLDFEREKIIVRDKHGSGLVSFYSIYKPKITEIVEDKIKFYQEVEQPEIFQDQPINVEM